MHSSTRLPLRPRLILAASLLFLIAAAHARAGGTNNTSTGTGALPASNTGSDNTADGFNALHANTTANANTATGSSALGSNTTGSHNTATGAGTLQTNTKGHENTADGFYALHLNTTGNHNTATGHNALSHNTTGAENSALGFQTLFANTTGSENLALGQNALYANTTGGDNTGVGESALFSNVSGSVNTACGTQTLYNNTGDQNTAVGGQAMFFNTSGTANTATGWQALFRNSLGSNNTAIGYGALQQCSGIDNIGIGFMAGSEIGDTDDNIAIGTVGTDGESGVIRIGTPGTHTGTFIAGIRNAGVSGVAVVVNSAGKLGVATSSERFKHDIRDMGAASGALLSLRPVAYKYKPEIDPQEEAQFGLVAEEVEKVDPSLVVHDQDGKPFTVRYEQINAMLLNEFLKEHARTQAQESVVREQAAAISRLDAALARQQAQIDVLRANTPDQAAAASPAQNRP